ncbi:MAG: Trk system potassium transporter TrkA [Lachnospiraceae bacterium]|nr:Trk system potassium transporter TrkA [Lachnospiraceae bacterium]
MHIIIVGYGNVGKTLASELTGEGHQITVIDEKQELVDEAGNDHDVLGICGNAVSVSVLYEAGVDSADLVIAVTGNDELNLLTCVIAKRAGGANCSTIARVTQSVFQEEAGLLRKQIGISLIVNTELESAHELARLIKYPAALEVTSFAKSRIEMMKLPVKDGHKIANTAVKDLKSVLGYDLFIGMIERDDDVLIPDGSTVIRPGDMIWVVTSAKDAIPFLKKTDFVSGKVKNVMMVGGGETAVYLTKLLSAMDIQVKIIENDKDRCDHLSAELPNAVIICGDGTDVSLLDEEDISDMDAFVAWTNIDEENVMLSSYVRSVSDAKLMTKVHRVNYDEILKTMNIGSVLYPKKITSDYIVRYVRALENGIGSNVETLYRLRGGKVEALEFIVSDDAKEITGKPLMELPLKKNVLICSIMRKGTIFTPSGLDTMETGDSVIVMTTDLGMNDLKDIFK